jgi:electron transport complex protein RnfC
VDIHDAYYNFDVDSILELDADLCMGCGSCSYICPAKRPLTQAATLARDLLKERGLKKNG